MIRKSISLSLIFFAIYLAGCTATGQESPKPAATLESIPVTAISRDVASSTSIPTDLPPAVTVEVPLTANAASTQPVSSPIPQPSYEVLAPNKIKHGDFTIDVTMSITSNEFHFSLNSEYPTKIAKSFPDEAVPPTMKDVEFKFKEMQLELKPYGGGGGGDEGDEVTSIAQEYNYHIQPTLAKGEKVHVTANVSFNDYVGIKETVPFEFDLVVK